MAAVSGEDDGSWRRVVAAVGEDDASSSVFFLEEAVPHGDSTRSVRGRGEVRSQIEAAAHTRACNYFAADDSQSTYYRREQADGRGIAPDVTDAPTVRVVQAISEASCAAEKLASHAPSESSQPLARKVRAQYTRLAFLVRVGFLRKAS